MIFPEVKIFDADIYTDFRGELWTLWKRGEFEPDLDFNHDKVSVSRKNVLRGIHGDSKSWKLITCLHGSIYFVVVDNRKDSPNYLKWDWIILDDQRRKSVLVPPMFGNGTFTLTDKSIFHYKWAYEGEYADVDQQFTIKWNDPRLDIPWPVSNPILQPRDR